LPSLSGLHVLVVDDEEDTRDLLAVVLRGQGAVVTAVATASEAMTTLGEGGIDVMVSDIGMPGEDGYTLMNRVRALGADQGGQVPAVALTAYARAEDRQRALVAGYQYHVPKPIEPGELVRMVARVGAQKKDGAESPAAPPAGNT
jgi:CheY-like chemotaxis protein